MTTYIPAAGSALYAKLCGASSVTNLVSQRVWESLAPPKSARPYIVYYLGSGRYPNAVPRDTINWVFRVEAVGDTRAKAEQVADAVFGTLHESTLTIPGWSNYWLAGEGVATLSETVDGAQRWRYIADFRVKASKD